MSRGAADGSVEGRMALIGSGLPRGSPNQPTELGIRQSPSAPTVGLKPRRFLVPEPAGSEEASGALLRGRVAMDLRLPRA